MHCHMCVKQISVLSSPEPFIVLNSNCGQTNGNISNAKTRYYSTNTEYKKKLSTDNNKNRERKVWTNWCSMALATTYIAYFSFIKIFIY